MIRLCSLSHCAHTPTHCLSLVLVVLIEPKELKTKISHTHSLILSYCALLDHASLHTHNHPLPITCTCCYDEIKGTQDQDLFSCSFCHSLILSHCALTSSRSLSLCSLFPTVLSVTVPHFALCLSLYFTVLSVTVSLCSFAASCLPNDSSIKLHHQHKQRGRPINDGV